MAITPVILPADADTYLALVADWLSLSDAQKTDHIYNATVYMQANWTCTDVDWDDHTSTDDDIKRACAYYADADRLGVLFPSREVTEKHRYMTSRKYKVEGLEEHYQWAESGPSASGDPLEEIHTIMKLYCTWGTTAVQTSLTRV